MMDAAAEFPWLDPFEEAAAEIWLRDSSSTLLWVNNAFVASVGRPREELIAGKLFPTGRLPSAGAARRLRPR
jgi:PAS domain-containing protein